MSIFYVEILKTLSYRIYTARGKEIEFERKFRVRHVWKTLALTKLGKFLYHWTLHGL